MTRRQFLALKAKIKELWRQDRSGAEANLWIQAAGAKEIGNDEVIAAFDIWQDADSHHTNSREFHDSDFALLATLDKLTKPKRKR
jgi:hypothetical protein